MLAELLKPVPARDVALAEIMHSLDLRLCGCIRRRMGTRVNPADMEDAIAHAWLQFNNGYDPDKSPIVPYVCQVACNWLIDKTLRRAASRHEVLATSLESNRGSDRETPEELLDRINAGGQAASLEEELIREERKRELLLTFVQSIMDCGLPHQVIAFIVVKLLEWPPRRVAAELSEYSLHQLESRFEDEYAAEWDTRQQPFIRDLFAPLRRKLKSALRELTNHHKTLKAYADLLDREVGGTTLQDYYRGDSEASIAHWWEKVRTCVLTAYARNPLPLRTGKGA